MKLLKHLNNEKGVALITVVVVFLVLVIMLGGAMYAAVVNQQNAILANEHTEAYYVAESGINLRVAQIEDFLYDYQDYDDYDPKTTSLKEYLAGLVFSFNESPTITLGNGNYATVVIDGPIIMEDMLPGADVYVIRSTGVVDGLSRTLELELLLYTTFGEGGESPMDKAVISRSSIIMTSGGIIRGDLFTNGEPLLIRFSGKDVVGPLLYLQDDDKLNNSVDPMVPINGGDLVCDNIYSLAWPNGYVVPDGNYTFDDRSHQGNNKAKCYDNLPIDEEEIRIFRKVVVPAIPEKMYAVSVDANNVLTLPDLRKIPGGFTGYSIENLDLTKNITVKLGSYGYATQLKKLYVSGDLTATSGTLRVEGTGRLMLMKVMDESNTSAKEMAISWGTSVIPDNNDATKFILTIKTPDYTYPAVDLDGSVTSSFANTAFLPLFSIQNNTYFIGSIMAENVNFDIYNVDYRGYILTNGDHIEIKATSQGSEPNIPIWLYAPIAQVELNSNITIYGSVMSKAVVFGSGSALIYKKMDALPIFDYLFYAPSDNDAGEINPLESTVLFSNIIEVDND